MRTASLVAACLLSMALVGCGDDEPGSTPEADVGATDGAVDGAPVGDARLDAAPAGDDSVPDAAPDDVGVDAHAPDAAPPGPERTVVVFGDTHVHTRYSVDAFGAMALGGELEFDRNVSEACDYARFCSGLDFFVSSEHAEFLTADVYGRVKREVQECNDASPGLGYPNFHAYMGFEWTQTTEVAGLELPDIADPELWGHKVVFFRDDGDDDVPARPIAAWVVPALGDNAPNGVLGRLARGEIPNDAEPADEYLSLLSLETCPERVPSPDIELEGCYEFAKTPDVLFQKLSEWNLPTLVGAHGTAWGLGGTANWGPQLRPSYHWPEYQRFLEIYSKHGNSEELRQWAPEREWRTVPGDAPCEEGDRACELLCVEPPAGQNFLPCCWRRVQLTLTREVCADPGSAGCRAAVASARRDGRAFAAEPDDDWLGCGECVDCFQPAARYAGSGSAQDALARLGEDGITLDVGFIGSTDTHHAAPGSVLEKKVFAEMVHAPEAELRLAADPDPVPSGQSSQLLYAGGLAAVHLPADAEPTREAILEAMQRREVFATSGARIWLWFHLVDGEDEHPMGSVVRGFGDRSPSFRVRALGAFPDTHECPAEGLPVDADPDVDFVRDVCRGVCHAPATEQPRLKILYIEVARVRRQVDRAEPIGDLVDHAWETFPCEGAGPEGASECIVNFTDDAFGVADRDTVYYVRAIQEPTPTVNGVPLGCIEERGGGCVQTTHCDQADDDDECLHDASERAWSSPIYVYRAE